MRAYIHTCVAVKDMYVRMYMYIHVVEIPSSLRIHSRTYVRMYIQAYACIYVCTYKCMRVYVYVHTYVYRYNPYFVTCFCVVHS